MRERIALVPLDDRLKGEASERYAAVLTEEEDLRSHHKVHLLREIGSLLQGLGERSSDRFYKKLARRLRNSVVDRTLYRRLEGLLSRRGVVLLESTSLCLLVLVFGLITVESLVTLDPGALWAIRVADASICSFFIAEFLFKLSLAPSKTSWFLRNFITDFLPAIPAVALLFTPGFVGGSSVATVRIARFFRVVSVARYLAFMRPFFSLARLILFLIRGLDALVERFSRLINRNFVFFEEGERREGEAADQGLRKSLFQSLRREHVLLDDSSPAEVHQVLMARSRDLASRLRGGVNPEPRAADTEINSRDVPVEDAIERLYTLRPDELNMVLNRSDLMALDRVSRIINAPVIRSLPFVRWFCSDERGATPESRVVDLGRRIADQMERWRNRVLFFADLHGIVTGPQILDRVATAMVKASQRPAVRLLMFGALFSIVRMFVDEESAISAFLGKFVATPLIVLGFVCLVILVAGRWMKRLAGEVAETLKRTSEAHFINLLELEKARTRDADLVFLASRVFRFEMDAWEAALALGQHVDEATSVHTHESLRPRAEGETVVERIDETPVAMREDLNRVAHLYMHFLDGAILHESDIKTTEQLLANLSLENIRTHHLRFSRRDEKRLRKLSLASGSKLTGPYLWFRFITESVSLETAKRITQYNRHCMTLQQRSVATPEQIEDMDAWLQKRRDEIEGRILEKVDPLDAGVLYRTTEFNSMDFLAVIGRRDAQIERVFGPAVRETIQLDRRCMIREIFGTKPLHKLPRSRRSVNFYRFFLNRMSRGRVLLLPVMLLGAVWWAVKNVVAKTAEIVKEILYPESATAERDGGTASFQVALRKIHRMKAPGLLEAMQMRASFDPAYCGAPPTWSFGVGMESDPEIERDMDFLQMRERDRAVMRTIAMESRRRIEQLHGLVKDLDGFEECREETEQKLGERAVSIAYVTNREGIRSLFQAERWLNRELPRFEDRRTRIRGSWTRSAWQWARRGFRPHPVVELVHRRLADRSISARGRRNLQRAYTRDHGAIRDIVHAWLSLPEGVKPRDHAVLLARDFFRANGEVSRELVALRAVQSLSVLDVRNYRDLVFRLGGYAEDGEDASVAQALP